MYNTLFAYYGDGVHFINNDEYNIHYLEFKLNVLLISKTLNFSMICDVEAYVFYKKIVLSIIVIVYKTRVSIQQRTNK